MKLLACLFLILTCASGCGFHGSVDLNATREMDSQIPSTK